MGEHSLEDEFFFVLQGQLTIELKQETVVLLAHQGYTIPKGVMHRPLVTEPTAVLMVEGSGIKPIGD